MGQNGSQHQEDKYHQSREHENSHHFHGPHHRAPTMSKDEAQHAQVVHGPSNRSAKSERARDFYHPKQEFARVSASSSHSLPSSPPVSSTHTNPGELPHPSELLQISADFDLAAPLDVRKPCDSPVVMLSGLSEGSSSLPVEFLYSEEALLDGGKKSGPQLKRSASVGHAYDLVKSDDPAVIAGLPNTIGEVIPTATTSQRYRFYLLHKGSIRVCVLKLRRLIYLSCFESVIDVSCQE